VSAIPAAAILPTAPLPLNRDSAKASTYQEGPSVANSKSAEKRIRVAARNAERNRVYRSSARTLVKKAELAIRDGDQEAAGAAVQRAISALDRTASKKVIHKNNAARRKSRLMAKFNAMGAEA
jgi:small subunit ribosomal protein S20